MTALPHWNSTPGTLEEGLADDPAGEGLTDTESVRLSESVIANQAAIYIIASKSTWLIQQSI